MDNNLLALDGPVMPPWVLWPVSDMVPVITLPDSTPPKLPLPKLPSQSDPRPRTVTRRKRRRANNDNTGPHKKRRRRADEIDRKYKCAAAHCDKSYGTEHALYKHFDDKHPTSRDETRPFLCKEPKCHRRFRTVQGQMVHAISVHGTKFNPAPICSLEDKAGSDATRMPLDVCTDRDKSASQPAPCLPLFAPDHTTGIPYSVGLLNSMLVFNLNLMTGLNALQAPKPGTLSSSRDDGAAALDLNDP